ncbi:MAG: 1-deoxy-D-xylulose-5-phosphate reductoisomerase [Nitrospirae bacterium]|nr:1-deoxy-D-xylulose-5-phosphate reductoisomerase [Nitrospirota bacterium]
MKNVVILGSTGSLGTQSIEILQKYTNDFRIIGLSANTSKEVLNSQVKDLEINPENIILTSLDGEDAMNELASLEEADIVINVLSGTAGIEPTSSALRANKTLLLGNKESLVAAGEEVVKLATPEQLVPLDSEHNAIYEILRKNPGKTIKKIIIPCSGGPFFGQKDLSNITAEQALAHPKWRMGKKVSIESATLLNKGLEIIEAHYLFNLPLEKIEARIHPECQIHGIVEFENDPNSHAYISDPDMREHIENALLRAINQAPQNRTRIIQPNEFTLLPPDHETFPGIKIVTDAFNRDRTKMSQFLKKEESLIDQFLQNKIKFTQIFDILRNFYS